MKLISFNVLVMCILIQCFNLDDLNMFVVAKAKTKTSLFPGIRRLFILEAKRVFYSKIRKTLFFVF